MTPELLAEVEQLEAELVRRASASGDPVVFARAVGLEPEPWQAKVLGWGGKRLLLNCARQAGKSTITSVLALHVAATQPKSLILLISPSLRQSSELFRKVTDRLALMASPPTLAERSRLSLTLENGSRIVSLPSSEATIRGFSAVTLIIEDEAAYVSDELHMAVLPMLAVSDGRLILMSTPNGRRGHFFEAWEHGGETWERVKVVGRDVPRISPRVLGEAKAAMGALYAQEYDCEFINAATGRVYHGYDDERNHCAEPPPLDEHLLGMDFGVQDDTAFTVLGWRAYDPCVYIVESYRTKKTSPSMAAEEAKRLEQRYRFAKIVGDLGGMGKAFAEEAITRFSLPMEPADKNNKKGYIALLNGDLERGRIKVVPRTCHELIDEWLTLPWAAGRNKEADGFANHAADSCLYAWRAATAFHNIPAPVRPVANTEAYYHDQQAALTAAAEEHFRTDREWWER